MAKVLLVDDEESVTRLMRMSLEDSGKYTVKTLNRPGDALETVKWFDPDVCVLDVIMPEMSGLELASQLKEYWGNDPKGIIFLTAAISKDDAGMHHDMLENSPVLAKPVGVEELIEVIDEVLA